MFNKVIWIPKIDFMHNAFASDINVVAATKRRENAYFILKKVLK